MRRFTQKGRVIYDRPRHGFTMRDLLRIAWKFQSDVYGISVFKFSEIRNDLILKINKIGDRSREFQGGEFGGGGATRDFGKPGKVDKYSGMYFTGRILIIVEIGGM